MTIPRNPDIAEDFVIEQCEAWPTLYRTVFNVFKSIIVGGSGDPYWKNGILIKGDTDTSDRPITIHDEDRVSRLLCRVGFFTLPSGWDSFPRPLTTMPDDLHDDWIDFIRMNLHEIDRITPEFYDILQQAYTIKQYKRLPDTHLDRVESNKKGFLKFKSKIPSFLARLQAIEDTKRLGEIPTYKYTGMYI